MESERERPKSRLPLFVIRECQSRARAATAFLSHKGGSSLGWSISPRKKIYISCIYPLAPLRNLSRVAFLFSSSNTFTCSAVSHCTSHHFGQRITLGLLAFSSSCKRAKLLLLHCHTLSARSQHCCLYTRNKLLWLLLVFALCKIRSWCALNPQTNICSTSLLTVKVYFILATALHLRCIRSPSYARTQSFQLLLSYSSTL